MFPNETFLGFVKKREIINQESLNLNNLEKELNKLSGYMLSFESIFGGIVFSIFSAMTAFLFFVLMISLCFGLLDYIGVDDINSFSSFVLICSGFISLACLFYFLLPKWKKAIEFINASPERDKLNICINDKKNKIHTLKTNLKSEMESFNMKDFLSDKNMAFFSNLKKSELDVIDDYKDMIKNHRGLKNYIEYNENEKAINYLLND